MDAFLFFMEANRMSSFNVKTLDSLEENMIERKLKNYD
jgi:hypothetical protein